MTSSILSISTYAGIPGTITLQSALRPATNGPSNTLFANLSHKIIFPRARANTVSALWPWGFGSAESMRPRHAWTKVVTPLARVIWPLTTALIAGRTEF